MKGNILENLLKIPIPFFDKNQDNNHNTIKAIMQSYITISEKQNELKRKIKDIEKSIDQAIYKFFNLTSEEIDSIEFSFGPESKIIQLLN